MKTFLMGVAAVLLACQSPASAWSKKEPFQLKIFQGFRFANESVVKSESGDLSFTYQVRRFGMISYLSAKRIQYFEKAPEVASLRASEIAGWKDYVAGPSPGFYVVRTGDGKHYLLHLQKFENQGKAASYWLMTFAWEEIDVR